MSEKFIEAGRLRPALEARNDLSRFGLGGPNRLQNNLTRYPR